MRLLIMDDDEVLLRTLQRRFSSQGHQVQVFAEPPPLSTVLAQPFDACLIDLRFGASSGLQYIAPLRAAWPQCRLFVLTGYASIATAVQAVKLGADDYLTKPVDFQLLSQALTGQPTAGVSTEQPDDLLSAEQVEWEHIQRVLAQQEGNISQTARALGMHRRTLQRKLQKRRPA